VNHQSDRFLKHNAFARRLGVDHAYLTRLRNSGRAVRDESTGTYDLQHPVNQALVVTAASTKTPEVPDTIDDEELVRLQREKLKFERDRTEAQARKYRLQNAVTLRDLMEVEQVKAMVGNIGSAVSQYLLPIPARVARGDQKLQARIEKELSEGLRRYREAVARAAETYIGKEPEVNNDDARED
jgi:phage terminase Nu1 subunit (DNA packaging protein)